jgi:sec-independent protein translocase protein TatA
MFSISGLLFLAGYEIVVLVLVVLLLFGGKKIPELMKGLGKGIKEFKKQSKEISEESEVKEETSDSD